MNKLKTILLPLFCFSTLFILSACNLQSYSNDQYTIDYPEEYTIQEPSPDYDVLTIRGKKGRIEIFKAKDEIRIHGYSSSGLEEYEAEYVPKEKLSHDGYSIWLFYNKNDEDAQEELQEIADSFEIK